MKGKRDLDRISELLACFPAIMVQKKANGVLIQILDLLFKINMRPLPTNIEPKLCIQVTNSLKNNRPS